MSLPHVDDEGRRRAAGGDGVGELADGQTALRLDLAARAGPGLEPATQVAGDGLVPDPQRLPHGIVRLHRVLDDEHERPRRRSTSQPSHVPNDDPAGIDSAPGACRTANAAGERRSTSWRAVGHGSARLLEVHRPRISGTRAPMSGGPAWLIGRIRAK